MLIDRKSTRLNSSHLVISYAVFCLKKKRIGTEGTIHLRGVGDRRGGLGTCSSPRCSAEHCGILRDVESGLVCCLFLFFFFFQPPPPPNFPLPPPPALLLT